MPSGEHSASFGDGHCPWGDYMTSALCIVAHPDDELLFAGALMASRPHWDWTLVALTGGERKDQFPGVSLGFEDHWRILTVPEFGEWKGAVENLGLAPDLVFTHNRLGEYGHPHHMAVHRIAHELYAPVWDFLYEGPTSIPEQDLGPFLTNVVVPWDKADIVAERYGQDTLRALVTHQPEMIAAVMRVERFTGLSAVPR